MLFAVYILSYSFNLDEVFDSLFSPAEARRADGKEAYLTLREQKSLQIIDIPGRKVVANIKLGGDPHGVAFRP